MKLRLLIANSRGLAAAAVAALALGIGITALMFAIVDGTVRRGLPVPRASEIVHLERIPEPGGERRTWFTVAERGTLEEANALSALAAYRLLQANVAAPGLTPRRWATAAVSANTFEILAVQAAHGQLFRTGAEQVEGVLPILISDEVWRIQFGGDPAAVGRAIHANGVPAVVTGIMPAGFRFPFSQHLWMPLDSRAQSAAVSIWGRSGIGEEEAENRLTAAYQQRPNVRARVGVAPFTSHIQGPRIVQLLEALFFAGLGVLAIACANVANLLLARGLARRRDFAIAAALGASRARIMRERVVEGLALAAPGVGFGILLTYAGAWGFTRAIRGSSPPYWVSVVVDTRVLAYAIAAATLSALIASVLPSLRSRSAAVVSDLANESRGTTSGTLRRTTAALIIVEIALASGVLIAAGLMTKGVVRLASMRYDFAVEDVTIGRVSLPARVYPDVERRRRFFETLFARLQTIPGATAALGTSYPFASAEPVPFRLDRSASGQEGAQVRQVVVSPGYFSTLGVGLIGGRDFESGDNGGRGPVAIVNLSFALKHARREDLIGRTIRIGAPDAPPAIIIGVAPDLAVGNPRGDQPEAIYVPLFQQASPPEAISVLARARGGGAPLERALRDTLSAIDPELPLDGVVSLAAFRESVTWFYRVFGYLLMAFGVAALALALVGVYAVMAFGVTRRRREIGTRMAFGATGGDIARMFLFEGSWRLAAGLAAGALLAAWLAPRLALLMFQVSPRDPFVYGSALLIVALVGFTACLAPALRAARQDPNACLRE